MKWIAVLILAASVSAQTVPIVWISQPGQFACHGDLATASVVFEAPPTGSLSTLYSSISGASLGSYVFAIVGYSNAWTPQADICVSPDYVFFCYQVGGFNPGGFAITFTMPAWASGTAAFVQYATVDALSTVRCSEMVWVQF